MQNDYLYLKKPGEVLSNYRAYFENVTGKKLIINYIAVENKGDRFEKRHEKARKHAFELEKLLYTKLSGIEVKRDNNWNLFLAEVK